MGYVLPRATVTSSSLTDALLERYEKISLAMLVHIPSVVDDVSFTSNFSSSLFEIWELILTRKEVDRDSARTSQLSGVQDIEAVIGRKKYVRPDISFVVV